MHPNILKWNPHFCVWAGSLCVLVWEFVFLTRATELSCPYLTKWRVTDDARIRGVFKHFYYITNIRSSFTSSCSSSFPSCENFSWIYTVVFAKVRLVAFYLRCLPKCDSTMHITHIKFIITMRVFSGLNCSISRAICWETMWLTFPRSFRFLQYFR